jgi:hypothetical protein
MGLILLMTAIISTAQFADVCTAGAAGAAWLPSPPSPSHRRTA